MKTAEDFTKQYFSAGGDLVSLLRNYGEEIRKQIIAVINEARQEGEWDIRSVRTRIERMKIE